tara:strand:- start:397 stop:633 length:237 start_codon:yes stop_codon:yes gene_type:complete
MDLKIEPEKYPQLSDIEIACHKAKLDTLEFVVSTFNCMRESLTQELIANGISDSDELERKLSDIRKAIEDPSESDDSI